MEYHKNRFIDGSLLIYKKKELVALLPANKVNNILHSHQGLTYGGMVYSKSLKYIEIIDCFKNLLQYLNINGIKALNIKCLPSIYQEFPSNSMEYIYFMVQAKRSRADILSVVIPQIKKYSNSRKEGYQRGVKNQLNVIEEHDFSTFWNSILIPNLKKKHNVAPVHSLKEIQHLKNKFPKNIRLFGVYKDELLLGGSVIFETTYVAHAQYISSDANKNQFGTLDYLHIYLMENTFKDKRYFDFGISNENKGKNINEGLLFWKEGFGSLTFTQSFYEVSTANYKLLDTILK